MKNQVIKKLILINWKLNSEFNYCQKKLSLHSHYYANFVNIKAIGYMAFKNYI